MSDGAAKETGSGGKNTYLLVPIFLFFALLIFAVIRAPNLISSAGIGSVIIVVAPLVLATYALTVIVMAGRAGVDLSIGPLIGFINVSLIQLSTAGFLQSPILVFLFAMAVGVAYQVLMALIIVYVRVQPIIVSLSGYLALVGLNLVILPRPGGVAPEWMMPWGAGTSIFSPILVILVLATIAWYLLAQTAFWGHLKLMGSDERAAYTSGVRIYLVRIGAHAIAGIYAGLSALTFTSLISSGDPTQGTTYTLMAVTALVLGGANLAGGRGSAFGSLLGSLNIYLITYVLATFNFGRVQSFVTDLAYGVMLVVSLLISVAVPLLQRRVRGLSPLVFFLLLSIPALGVIVHQAMDRPIDAGGGASGIQSGSAIQSGSSAIQSASSGIQSASAQLDAAAAGGGTGTIFLIIAIGVVAAVALFWTVAKHRSVSSFGFAAIVCATGLGMIFNGGENGEGATAGSDAAAPGFFAMEPPGASVAGTLEFGALSPVVLAVMLIAGVILLTSLIVFVALPGVEARRKKVSMWWLAAALGALALGVVALDAPGDGYLAVLRLGEAHIATLFALFFFVLVGPLVHTRFRDISTMYIVSLGVMFVAAVYFFAGGGASSGAQYAAPIVVAPELGPAPEAYPQPARTFIAPADAMPGWAQFSYACCLVVLVHICLRLAMGQTTFRDFWPFLHIIVPAVLAGGAVFYAIGAPLWKIATVIVIGVLTAPISFLILNNYLRQRDRDRFLTTHWRARKAAEESAA